MLREQGRVRHHEKSLRLLLRHSPEGRLEIGRTASLDCHYPNSEGLCRFLECLDVIWRFGSGRIGEYADQCRAWNRFVQQLQSLRIQDIGLGGGAGQVAAGAGEIFDNAA